MIPKAIKLALLESYAQGGGINHIDGANLPSQDRVNELARDLMHLLFPGFFEESSLTQTDAPAWLSPASSARSWVWRPLYLGSREGWMLNIFPSQRRTKSSPSTRM